ncbi:MAG: hypothetical protein V1779_06365 [bacterium]
MNISLDKILILILITNSISVCQTFNPIHERMDFNIDSVKSINIILDEYKQYDLNGIGFFLNKYQKKAIINKFNTAQPKGLCDFIPEYWLTLKLLDDSIINFKILDEKIKVNDEWCFSIDDSDFIDSFYNEIIKEGNNILPSPSMFIPITLLTEELCMYNGYEKYDFVTFNDEFPNNWVKTSDIDTLISILNSQTRCKCLVSIYSSYIPFEDFAEMGGYAAIFIQLYKEKKAIIYSDFLYDCPKINKQLNDELIQWWNQTKNMNK